MNISQYMVGFYISHNVKFGFSVIIKCKKIIIKITESKLMKNGLDNTKKSLVALCILLFIQLLSGCTLPKVPRDTATELSRIQIALDDASFRMTGLMADGTVRVNALTSTNGYTSDVTAWQNVRKIEIGRAHV